MPQDPKSIFVVDDDEMLTRLGAQIFRSHGYAVRTFSSVADCLAAVAARAPDCIVSDLQMPGLDGAQLIEALRARALAVPVIIVTAASGPSLQLDRARRAGAYRILAKPYSRPELLDVVAQVLGEAEGSETEAQGQPSPGF